MARPSKIASRKQQRCPPQNIAPINLYPATYEGFGIEPILRIKSVLELTGLCRSTLYRDIGLLMFTKPIAIGPASVGWPASEVGAINRARIAGKSDAEIQVLVAELHRKRKD